MRDEGQPLLCAFSFNYHDSSVAIARGNRVLRVVEAERVLRRKKARTTPEEMGGLIKGLLKDVAATPDDVDHWAATALNNPWIDKACLADGVDTTQIVTSILGKRRACLVVGHHRCHAATFYFSGLDHALIGTCDGGGDDGQLSSWYAGNGLSLNRIDEEADPVPVSGLLYRYVSDFLFGRIHCEGKLMALAAYGTADQQLVTDLTELSSLFLPFDVEDGFGHLRSLLGDLDGRAVWDPLSVADIARSLQVAFEEADCGISCITLAAARMALFLRAGHASTSARIAACTIPPAPCHTSRPAAMTPARRSALLPS
jgi:predicted NodU family carbamoyl transferase